MNEGQLNAYLITLPLEVKMALVDITTEYKRACLKHPDWSKYDTVHRAAVVAEEAGELVRACLQHQFEQGEQIEMTVEAIQTASTAMRFLIEKP